ncbi:hypothetical protein J3F84DRAFT_248724 [Trichoderma pleuroticola]
MLTGGWPVAGKPRACELILSAMAWLTPACTPPRLYPVISAAAESLRRITVHYLHARRRRQCHANARFSGGRLPPRFISVAGERCPCSRSARDGLVGGPINKSRPLLFCTSCTETEACYGANPVAIAGGCIALLPSHAVSSPPWRFQIVRTLISLYSVPRKATAAVSCLPGQIRRYRDYLRSPCSPSLRTVHNSVRCVPTKLGRIVAVLKAGH